MQQHPQPPIDDASRFMSAAIDWRRVLTMTLVGIPCAVAIYAGSQQVLASSVGEIQRQLAAQHAAFTREVDQVREDVRELRRDLNDIRKDRRSTP